MKDNITYWTSTASDKVELDYSCIAFDWVKEGAKSISTVSEVRIDDEGLFQIGKTFVEKEG